MNSLLTVDPVPSSVTTDPMTIEEIDNHADKDKIWATIAFVRHEAGKVGYDNGWADSYGESNEY